MFILPIAVAAYIIGSFPTAYVIGKHIKGIDILRSGTGNVGAMNAYEVTGSKRIGFTVVTIDILKGLMVTILAQYKFGLTASFVAALFAVVGHNYSIFLGFKGGRGLATSAGALLIIDPLSVAVYLLVYGVLRAAKLKLYISSVSGIATASIPLFTKFVHAPADEALVALLMITVLSRHLTPLKNELKNGG